MANSSIRSKLKIAVILITVTASILGSSAYVFGLLGDQNTVNTSGVIADISIGVYSNSACTQNCTYLDWIVCYPGESKTQSVYVKNLGTVDATLSIFSVNWNPTIASSFLSLTSDYSGQVISPGAFIPINFTLTISPDISQIEAFTFDIQVVSEG